MSTKIAHAALAEALTNNDGVLPDGRSLTKYERNCAQRYIDNEPRRRAAKAAKEWAERKRAAKSSESQRRRNQAVMLAIAKTMEGRQS